MATVTFRNLGKQSADPHSGKLVTAVNDLNLDIRDGGSLDVVFDSEKLHDFDKETGLALV